MWCHSPLRPQGFYRTTPPTPVPSNAVTCSRTSSHLPLPTPGSREKSNHTPSSICSSSDDAQNEQSSDVSAPAVSPGSVHFLRHHIGCGFCDAWPRVYRRGLRHAQRVSRLCLQFPHVLVCCCRARGRRASAVAAAQGRDSLLLVGTGGFWFFFSPLPEKMQSSAAAASDIFWRSPLVVKASELTPRCSFRCEIVEQSRSCRGRKHLVWNISLIGLRDSVYSCTSEHSNWLKRLKVVLWGVFFFFHLINLFVYFPFRCVFLAIFIKGKKYEIYLHNNNTSIFFLSLLQ